MTKMQALGHTSAQAVTKVLTIPAFTLNKSSRVIPGLRGTPAGMTTTSQPSKDFFRSSPTKPVHLAPVQMCERSAATPGVMGATSKQVRAVTRGLSFMSKESGCPIPPAAPRTLHLKPLCCTMAALAVDEAMVAAERRDENIANELVQG